MPGPLYPIQPVFARGELSPRLFSRVDIDHWKMGLAKCVNWLVMKQGGLRRRPGTEWVSYGKFPYFKCRLERFVFSTLQAYVIEFGSGYIRMYANGGIVARNSSTGITFTAPSTVNWPAHGLAASYPVMFSTTGVLPAPLVPGVTYYVTGGDANSFQITTWPGYPVITFTSTGYGTHGVVAPIEIGTPYDYNEIWNLQFSQSADVLYIASTKFEPMMLSRFSGATFALLTYSTFDGPYLPGNTTPTTMAPGGTAGDVSITASATQGINGNAGFQPTDVNRWISLQYSSKWYAARIFAVTSTTVVQATVHGLIDELGNPVGAFPATTATGGWRLGAWSEVTGWPGCVTFYQQRLVWARTDTQPQTVWMSKAGILDNFATTSPLQDDDALTLTILAGEVNEIAWMAEGPDLMIGTSGAMRTIGPADSSKNFGPNNFMQKRQSTFGSLAIQPVQVGEVAIYPGFFGLSLREFMFSFQVNGYVSPELTVLSEHMLRSGIKQFNYAQDRDSIIWCAMGNGELVGVTYDRDQQIVAMTRHRIGGVVKNSGIVDIADPDNPDTPYGVVESVTTIPGPDRHEVWLSVRRTINGADVRHIERMTMTFEAMPKENAVFVDASFSYKGAAATGISGANWLAGESCAILADGAISPNQTLSDAGSFTLANGGTAKIITFGLNYTSTAMSLPIAQGQPDGTGIGRRKNIIYVNIDVMETGYLEVGSPSARELQVKVGLRHPEEKMDDSPPLHDGMVAYRFDRSWRDNGQIVMQTDRPLPATIRSITPVFDGEP